MGKIDKRQAFIYRRFFYFADIDRMVATLERMFEAAFEIGESVVKSGYAFDSQAVSNVPKFVFRRGGKPLRKVLLCVVEDVHDKGARFSECEMARSGFFDADQHEWW